MNKIKTIIRIFVLLAFLFGQEAALGSPWWDFQSIDTMKYSRDLAREKKDSKEFEESLALQIKDITATGATHVAIATPYDEEFIPFLKMWVKAARENELKIWFRGNFSGWEGWFDYPKISREEHIEKTKNFLNKNKDLFEDGDVFSACPECENGGPGDPRSNGDIEGHRKFLIEEYNITSKFFLNSRIKVKTTYNSMNGDVARLIMNPETTQALGGVVVVDHYVKNPEQLAKDVKELATITKGKVVLGEFGAPIPDIHDWSDDVRQARWLSDTLSKLSTIPELEGLSYWTNLDGSTQIWNKPGNPRKAALTLESYYKPMEYKVRFINELDEPIMGVLIQSQRKQSVSNSKGETGIAFLESDTKAHALSGEYIRKELDLKKNTEQETIVLKKKNEDLIFMFKKFFKKFWGNLSE
ncbi:MAG: hypothetical protein AAB443_00215 [Patescibacteria group bacterium]